MHGKKGERDKYFDDDDALGLKDLVARERSSTTSGDALFTRYAGHNQKLDDDFTMDDLVVDRLGRQDASTRDRAAAKSRAISGECMSGAVRVLFEHCCHALFVV